MSKVINIAIHTASNGVYFTHDGKTTLFTDPTLLGDHLFDMAIDLEAGGGVLTYDLFVGPVSMNSAIPQIKMIREITGLGLKESKDVCDSARNSGDRIMIRRQMDEAEKDQAKRTINSWTHPAAKSFSIEASEE